MNATRKRPKLQPRSELQLHRRFENREAAMTACRELERDFPGYYFYPHTFWGLVLEVSIRVENINGATLGYFAEDQG